MTHMDSRDRTVPDLDAVVARIVDVARPLRIVLFGSRARGDHHERSDTDLFVVVPVGVRCLDVAKDLYGLGIPGVDFVVANEDAYERRKGERGLIYREVAREGRELYAA